MTDGGRGRRVGILGHVGRPGVQRAALELRRFLTRQRCQVRIEERLATEVGEPGAPLPALASWCQTLISLGGDGTALAGARALAGRRAALLPVNFGGLGFLTAAEADELRDATRAVLAGAWPVERRGIVRARLIRGERTLRHGLAMNDVVIKAAGGYAAVHLRLDTLGAPLGHLLADGLIVASPSGSTAYSLSAGGPVVAPDVHALVVTPVCAHSLGSRSLVLPPRADITVRVVGSSDRCVLLFDGQDPVELEPRDQMHAHLAPAGVRVYRNPGRPFARSLQVKLGWQGSARRSL